ncbi:MAG: hypothetical protein E6Q56_00405 [Mycobacterium sp.]|nr:MAG: hypothetical protein E6Q56_00405 [Mycobacterium sp.]
MLRVDPAGRGDLLAFTERALRLDEAAVIRLRVRADGLLGAWMATGFDVLAVRVVPGSIQPADMTCAADALFRGLRGADADGRVDPGFPMDSAWRGALPPEVGFVHVDDVPAPVFGELARQGADLAREHGGAHGPPVSLMDQQVLEVSGGGATVGVPMRCVLALTAMGFVGDPPPGAHGGGPGGDVVRVRATPVGVRIDARFGSVYRRRGGPELFVRTRS